MRSRELQGGIMQHKQELSTIASVGHAVIDAHTRPELSALVAKLVMHRMHLIRFLRRFVGEHKHESARVSTLDHRTISRSRTADVAFPHAFDRSQRSQPGLELLSVRTAKIW